MMKKYILASLLTCLAALQALACGLSAPVHNYYVFDVFESSQRYFSYQDELYEFWKKYTGVTLNESELSSHYTNVYSYGSLFFDNDCAFIMRAARQKRDKPMMAYIEQLIVYNKVCNDPYNQWDYPSAEDLAKRRKALLAIAQTAADRLKGKLRPQYALLHMRANMMTGRYTENFNFWNSEGRRLPQGIYREMCRNIYANALLHLPNDSKEALHRQMANEIYAEQGDELSMMWRLQPYRTVDGIRKIYAESHNSAALVYLVQQFVNAAQETADSNGNEEAIEIVGFLPTYANDARQFIDFSRHVLCQGQVRYPCLWLEANAMLHYTMGDHRTAFAEADEAMRLHGTQRMLDVARAIRLLAAASSTDLRSGNTAFIAQELRWLDQKTNPAYRGYASPDYFAQVKDRIAYTVLVPHYRKLGNENMVTAILSAFQSTDPAHLYNSSDYSTWNYMDFEMSSRLDSLTANQAMAYTQFLRHTPVDPLQRYFVGQVEKDTYFFLDLIGTKLLREGRLAEAIGYLRRLPMMYVNSKQSGYAARPADYTRARWFGKQPYAEDYDDEANPIVPAMARNYKLAFCEDVLQLQSRYQLAANDSLRSLLAYELAKRYYQVSPYGDCWYLTRNYHSMGDSTRTFEKDFAEEALRWLDLSRRHAHGNPQAVQRCLFARAHVLLHRQLAAGYYWASTFDNFLLTVPDIHAAYADLAASIDSSSLFADPRITRCDVLMQFYRQPRNVAISSRDDGV